MRDVGLLVLLSPVSFAVLQSGAAWCDSLARVSFLLNMALKAEIVKAPLLLFCQKHSCSWGERLRLFGWCLDESGQGEDGTDQSCLNNSFAPYLFTAEDFLARGGHLVPVSEHSSSAVCWEKLVSSTTGAQNTSGWCVLCWSWKNMVYLWPFLD